MLGRGLRVLECDGREFVEQTGEGTGEAGDVVEDCYCACGNGFGRLEAVSARVVLRAAAEGDVVEY